MWYGVSQKPLVSMATCRGWQTRLFVTFGDGYRKFPLTRGLWPHLNFCSASHCRQDPRRDKASLGRLAVDLDANPSPLKLARALAEYVADKRQSTEYAEIARKAATDVIAAFDRESKHDRSPSPETMNGHQRFGEKPATEGDFARYRACSSENSWNAT